jgi:photosystem II stability/assembly factor-like uncharacterized protein
MASGIYTNDSDLGMAAVHAGLIRPGETATIRVVNTGRSNNFVGSTRNGVTSLSRSTDSCGIQLELVSVDTPPPTLQPTLRPTSPPVTAPPPTPAPSLFRVFYDVAVSGDGNTILAVGTGGFNTPGEIWRSTDGGQNWAKVLTTPSSSLSMQSVVMSKSSNVALAIASHNSTPTLSKLYVSTNAGATWTQRDVDRKWEINSLFVSSDGARMYAAYNGGILLTSTNQGTTWTSLPVGGLGSSSSIAGNFNGEVVYIPIVISGGSFGSLNRNTNSFTSSSTPLNSYQINVNKAISGWRRSMCVNSTGSTVVGFLSFWDSVVRSTNATARATNNDPDWTVHEITPEPAATAGIFRTIASDSGVSTLYACSSNSFSTGGSIYKSTNGGVNWTRISSGVQSNKNWYSIDCSSSGQKVVAISPDGTNYGITVSSNGGSSWQTFGIS